MNTQTTNTENADSSHILKWLFAHLLPYKYKVIFAIIALLIGAMAWLLLGQGVSIVIDKGFNTNNQALLQSSLLAVLAIAFIGSIATYCRFYLMVWLGERVCADIRQDLFAHLVTLTPTFFEETRTGEVISRFTSDTTLLQSVVGTGVSMALRSFVMVIGALLLMMYTSPTLTLYVFIAVPMVLLPIKILGKQVRLYSKKSQDSVASMGTLVDENLHEIHTLQSYNHEIASVKEFSKRIDQVMLFAAKRIHYRALLIAGIMFISLSAIFIVGYVGALDVLAGKISIGELTAFVFYAVLAGGAIATISEVIGDLQKAVGASERIVELMNTVPSIINPIKCRQIVPTYTSSALSRNVKNVDDKAAIVTNEINNIDEINNIPAILAVSSISFSYPSMPFRTVIDSLSFDIFAGQKVAIVGHSGAGKSTIFDLLMRFYDVNQGSIHLFGVPIQHASLTQVRSQFALVPQDAVIFALSVLDNIKLSKPEASDEDVISAAKLAYAHDFIEQFNDGYHTQLGERGVKLSGGQKQRIAIARAILAARPILLLDEATSALDASSEQYVKQALDSLMKNTTTLIIAHRLSTVMNADNILVLEKGKLIGSGTHLSLFNNNAVYKEFVNLQLTDKS